MNPQPPRNGRNLTDLRDPPGAFLTMKNGQRLFAAPDWVKGALGFSLVPAVIGGGIVIISPAMPFREGWLTALGLTLLYAPFVSAFLSPAVLLLFALAMRVGLAGWATTLLAAILLTLGATVLFGDLSVATALTATALGERALEVEVAVVHALNLWVVASRIEPDAFTRRVNPF